MEINDSLETEISFHKVNEKLYWKFFYSQDNVYCGFTPEDQTMNNEM